MTSKDAPFLVGIKTVAKVQKKMENSEVEKEKKGRGGARTGAGRPRGRNNYRSIALRIPKDVANILDAQENRSAYIIEAIRAYDKEQRKHTILGVEISYTKQNK